MKRSLKSILGVTLLEIMLVLAIAAMIIIMSVRYYQSATASQQANGFIAQVQAITAGMDSLAQGPGTYVGITQSGVAAIIGPNNLQTGWNTPLTITATGPTTFTIAATGMPAAVCAIVSTRLTLDKHITGATCDGSGAMTITYTSTV